MQHFILNFKTIIRNKAFSFWIMVFPLFLGTLFHVMFGNIDDLERYSSLSVGVYFEDGVSADDVNAKTFLEVLKTAETDEGKPMFLSETMSKEECTNALKDDKIVCAICIGETLSLTADSTDSDTSFTKVFLDMYIQNEALITEVAKTSPDKLPELIEKLQASNEMITSKPLSGSDQSPYAQYFFALLSMTCHMASMSGMNNGEMLQANNSAVGARRCVSPKKKSSQIMADFLSNYTFMNIVLTVQLFIFDIVFKQDFDGYHLPLLLILYCGNFTGLTVGYFISIKLRCSAGMKEGLCTTFFMVSSFLSGLMWADITYYLEKYAPIVNRINPATLIVNAFKSLIVFSDNVAYATNLITLFLIGVVFMTISMIKARRTRYASI